MADPTRSCRSRPSGASASSCPPSPRFSVLELLVVFVWSRQARLPEGLFKTLRQRPSGMMAARPQQLIARGDFDQNRHASTGRYRHPDKRHPQPKQLVGLVIQAEALVFATRLPAFQLDDELHTLGRARRGYSEEILDVDDAEPAQLHVVSGQLRARTDENRFRPAADFHRIVGD